MKLRELMEGRAPKANYEGWVTNDDYVIAINTKPNTVPATAEDDYAVVEMGIAGLDAQLNPVTQDKQYIRSGQTTMKTGTQRSFAVTGDRFVGDEAQDYCLSHGQKYGTGNAVVTDYVYFNILNGAGEKGQVSIIVNSDGSGNAGESSAVDIEFKKIGATPKEYVYSGTETEPEVPTELGSLNVTSNPGTAVGDTRISVSPALSAGNSYKYKTAASPTLPAFGQACTSGYTAWDGTADITAATGQKIVIVEVDADNRAINAGMAIVSAKAA